MYRAIGNTIIAIKNFLCAVTVMDIKVNYCNLSKLIFSTKCCIKKGIPLDCLQIALNLMLRPTDLQNGNPLKDISKCSKHADDIHKCIGKHFSKLKVTYNGNVLH